MCLHAGSKDAAIQDLLEIFRAAWDIEAGINDQEPTYTVVWTCLNHGTGPNHVSAPKPTGTPQSMQKAFQPFAPMSVCQGLWKTKCHDVLSQLLLDSPPFLNHFGCHVVATVVLQQLSLRWTDSAYYREHKISWTYCWNFVEVNSKQPSGKFLDSLQCHRHRRLFDTDVESLPKCTRTTWHNRKGNKNTWQVLQLLQCISSQNTFPCKLKSAWDRPPSSLGIFKPTADLDQYGTT